MLEPELIKPYSYFGNKKKQITTMFDNISAKYDFINKVLTFGIDSYWRYKAVKIASCDQKRSCVLDLAVGTGDLAIQLGYEKNIEKVIGLDISNKMLEIAARKIKKKNLSEKILLEMGDAENIKYKDESFNVVTMSFGIRNLQNIELCINEIYRVLTLNGKVVILEFSHPTQFIIKVLYRIYLFIFVSNFGKLVSSDRYAYKYLIKSIEKFPQGTIFLNILSKYGFTNLQQIRLTFGIATIYVGFKKI